MGAGHYEQMARRVNPDLRPPRAKRDDELRPEIRRIWEENRRAYGAYKVWRQSHREGRPVARCTVERLMRDLGISGVRRGRRFKTTIPDDAADRPADLVNRQFVADRPNLLGPIGDIPPVEFESMYYRDEAAVAVGVGVN